MLTILVGLMLTADAEPEPRRCQIDVRVTQTDPAAPRSEQRERVVGEPKAVTQFARPAFFRIGKVLDVSSSIHGPGVGKLVSGIELAAVPMQLPDGRIRLEVGVWPAGNEPGSDLVIDLKSGKTFRFAGPEGHRIELTVTELVAEK